MITDRCFVCGSPFTAGDTGQQSYLERQLRSVFVLRQLLNLPLESLEKCFLVSGGEDPESWFSFCGGECQEIVNMAHSAYREMCTARQKLIFCQKEIQDKLRLSLANSSFTTLDYRTEILEMVREVVSKKNNTEPQDFAAGDRMADQLLGIRQAISNQPNTIPHSDVGVVLPKIEPEDNSSELFEDMDHDDNWPNTSSVASPLNTTIKIEDDSVDRRVTPVKLKCRKKRQTSADSTVPVAPQQQKEKCPQCDFWGFNLQKHTETVHPSQTEATFTCDQCDNKSFNTEMRLQNHIRNCHHTRKIVTLNCPHCNYTTLQKSHLKRHVMIRHERSRVFICEICQKEFNLPENLRIHQASNHNKCSVKVCGKIFKSQQKLRDHQVTFHGKEVDIFQCPDCEKLCINKSILKDHKKVHHRDDDEEIYLCRECNKTFTTQKYLKNHFKKVHLIPEKKVSPENMVLGI